MYQSPYQPPGAAPVGMPPGMQSGSYEFTPHQNQDIEKTAARTRLWGIVSLVGGLLGLVFIVLFIVALASDLLAQLGTRGGIAITIVFGFLGPLALVYAVVGKLYIDSGNALREVVTTQGNDVQHLMKALDKVANAFRLEVIMSVISFGIGFAFTLLYVAGVVLAGAR